MPTINPNPGASQWPSNYQGCTITGHFLDIFGVPIVGTVTLAATVEAIVDPGQAIVITPRNITTTLDSNGNISVTVPATDDPDVVPLGFTYIVRENWVGGRPPYYIFAPMNTIVDLSTVPMSPANAGDINTFLTASQSATLDALAAGTLPVAPPVLHWVTDVTNNYVLNAYEMVGCDTRTHSVQITLPTGGPCVVKWALGSTTIPTIIAPSGRTIDPQWGGFPAGSVGSAVTFSDTGSVLRII